MSGGSMAAAQVSGAAALILSAQPWMSVGEVKTDILSHVDGLPALAGKVETGGRLDVCRAIPGCQGLPAPAPEPPPPPPAQSAVSPFQAPVPRAVIRKLKIAPFAFKAAKSGPAILPATQRRFGAIVSYVDSQPATTEFTVLLMRGGVLNGAHRCVAPARRRRPQARAPKHCIRFVTAGRFTRNDRAGANRFRFSGHIGRVRLRPGSYRLRAVPTFAGVRGTAAVAGFRISA
jgi:hypothetical protein